MPKQLNINLAFTADTEQAKAQIQGLQNQLTGLLNSSGGMSFGQKITGDISKASKAIAELKVHLQNATNVDTGALDFTKLNNSISKSGMTLSEYGAKLRSLGPAGQQAFNTLASSVAQSEIPIRRSNEALTQMWTTLKNTARWQISSSILHGFMGAIQSAVGYAQDLNESLNNIRIVTGQTTDQMAKFAERAQRSAKELSTTTTEYTNASLIYYQQGLDDSQVKERTDVTIKLANVSRQSAEEVSEQLTAIWNNFDDGTKSLESYADVLTALGAKTASSTEEIAGGIEKFAAVGRTIGLSYEYAAAALATITANTRQSEDVVGTALKTLFARMEGLKLGETLEDGVNLNKYSEALQSVGVNILDATGNLKDADVILDATAEKWETLSKAQQVALAQTVAGVRQYNQFIALMDNWNNGDNDSMVANLETAASSSGALQKQADIYGESWEAARDRVKAAMQGIYEDLLDDKAFISVLNIIEKIITYFDNLIDGIGGLGGVLSTLGAILTRVFSQQMAQGLTNMANNLRSITKSGREALVNEKRAFIQDSVDAVRAMSDGSKEGNTRANMMEGQLILQDQMLEKADRMTELERQTNQQLLDRQRILGDNAIAAAKELDAAKEKKSDASFKARTDIVSGVKSVGFNENEEKELIKLYNNDFTELQKQLKNTIRVKVDLKELENFQKKGQSSAEVLNKIKEITSKFDDEDLKAIVADLDEMDLQGEDAQMTLANLVATVEQLESTTRDEMVDNNLIKKETVDDLAQSFEEEANAENKVKQATEEANKARDAATDSINNAHGAQATWADKMVTGANVAMSLTSALQSMKGIFDVATNPDMSGFEKFLSISSSLVMTLTMLMPLFSGTNLQLLASLSASLGAAFGMKQESVSALEASAATGTLSATLWTLLWPIGLVIAAIGALVAIIYLVVKAHNADVDAAKAATQAAEELSSAYDDCKKSYEDMIKTMENYKTAREGLDSLIKGTDEYKQKLQEANQAAIELIQNNPELFKTGEGYHWDGDQLIISESAQRKALDSQQQALDNAFTAKNMSKVIADREWAKVGKNDLIENVQSQRAGEVSQGFNDETFSKLVELYKKDQNLFANDTYFEERLKQSGIFSDALITALIDNRDSIQNASDKVLTASNNYKLVAESNVKALLTNNKALQNYSDKEDIEKSVSERYSALYNKELKKLEKDDFGTGGVSKATSVNNKAKEYWEQYARATGLQGTQLVDTTGSDKNRVYVYLDNEGNRKEVSLEAMKEAVAATNANNKVNQSADTLMQINDKLSSISKKEDQNASLVRDMLVSNNFDNYKGQGFDSLQGSFNEISEREAKGLGYDSKADYIEDMKELVNQAQAARQEIVNSWGMSMNEMHKDTSAYYTQWLNKLTNSELQSLDYLSRNLNISMKDLLKEKTGKLDDLKNVANELANIDFSQGKVTVDDLGESYKKLTQGTQDAIETFIEWKNRLEVYKSGLEDLDRLNKKIDKSFSDIVKDVDPEILTQYYKNLADSMGITEDQAKELTRRAAVLSSGLNKLKDNIKKYNILLDKSKEKTLEYAEAMVGLRDTLIDLYGVEVDDDFLKNKLTEEDLTDLEQAANGSEEALERFRKKISDFAKEKLIKEVEVNINDDEAITKLRNTLDRMQEIANKGEITEELTLDARRGIQALQDLASQGQVSAGQIQGFLNSIGWNAPVETKPVKAHTTTKFSGNVAGIPIDGEFDHTEMIDVPIIGNAKVYSSDKKGWDAVVDAAGVTGTKKDFDAAKKRGKSWTNDYNSYGDFVIKKAEDKGLGYNQRLQLMNHGYAVVTDSEDIESMTKKLSEDVSFDPSKISNNKGGNSGGNTGGKVKSYKAPPEREDPEKVEDHLKKLDDEIDRYHEINETMEDQERILKDIGVMKDRVYGPDRIKYIDKEIKATKDLLKFQKEYLKQARQYKVADIANLNSVSSVKVQLDSDGSIINYNEIIAAAVSQYNAGQSSYVALVNQAKEIQHEKAMYEYNYEEPENKTQEQENEHGAILNEYDKSIKAVQKQAEEIKEATEKAYEEFKDALERYEESEKAWKDGLEDILEKRAEIVGLVFEKIDEELDYIKKFDDFREKVIDFRIKTIGEDALKTSKTLTENAKKTGVLNRDMSAIDKAIDDVFGTLNDPNLGINFSETIEHLYDLAEQAMETAESALELMEYEMNTYPEFLDQMAEKYSKITDRMDANLDMFFKYKDVLELTGEGKQLITLPDGRTIDKATALLETEQKVLKSRLDSNKGIYEGYLKEYQDMVKVYEQSKVDGTESEYYMQMLEEKIRAAEEKLRESESNMIDDLIAYGELAQEILDHNLEVAKNKFEFNLFGSSLEDQMKEVDRLSQKQEEYLTNTNKMYETNKLIRQAQLDMDKTTNENAKRQYNDYMKYVEQLQKSGKLSEFELSIAQARYDVLQAQIALEEAKEAKDSVRLMRDSEGNFGYVYTANQDKIAEAQQKYEDAQNKLYNTELDGAKDYNSKIFSLMQNYNDDVAELIEKRKNKEIQSDEELQQRIDELKKFYYAQYESYHKLYNIALAGMEEDSYNHTVDYELKAVATVSDFEKNSDIYLGEVQDHLEETRRVTEDVAGDYGLSFDDMKTKTGDLETQTDNLKDAIIGKDGLTEAFKTEALEVRTLTSIFAKEFVPQLETTIQRAKDLSTAIEGIAGTHFGEIMDSETTTEAIAQLLDKGLTFESASMQQMLNSVWKGKGGKDDTDYQALINSLDLTDPEQKRTAEALEVLRKYKILRTDWNAIKNQTLERNPEADTSWIDDILNYKLTGIDYEALIKNLGRAEQRELKEYILHGGDKSQLSEVLQYILNVRQVSLDHRGLTLGETLEGVYTNDELLDWLEDWFYGNATEFDGGGYTGQWGPSGRMAILHEKEIVLNKDDTLNFLTAIDTLRQISHSLDASANAQILAADSLFSSNNGFNILGELLNQQTLDQNVVIHADFPNVVDHNEIELAINDLVNAASQYANRK